MRTIPFEALTKTRSYEGEHVVVLRPSIVLTLYSAAPLGDVMIASADVLEAYLDFVPPDAIVSRYAPPSDEYSPDGFDPFGTGERAQLLQELRSGTPPAPDADDDFADDSGYGFELAATLDGAAGHFGARLGAIAFDPDNEDDDTATSLLQLHWPADWLEQHEVDALVDFVAQAANQFPFCTGNAGMSFSYTVGYTSAAREEMQALLPRYLGFDPAYGSTQLVIRDKTTPAHWINLIDAKLLAELGGKLQLESALAGCELRDLAQGGLLIRGAKLPPVADVNRLAPDVGLLPVVANALKPTRFDDASETGLVDAQAAADWLERFDALPVGPFDNA